MKKTAVILVSGGMDSALTAAIAVKRYEPAFMHFNYGQRTSCGELKAFNDIARYFKVKKKLIADIGYLKKIGGSALTDRNIPVEEADLNRKSIPKTYVPFRNANLLAAAVSWAEVLGAQKIFIGAVEEDSSGYPDTTKKFYKDFNRAVKSGTKKESRIEIVTPVINMSKKEIVIQSYKYNSPVHLTWSCYKSNDIACGECDSCALRLRGFREAGIKDPVKYKKNIKW